MKAPVSWLECAGCGHEPPEDEPLPFRCPAADEPGDVDHVLRRRLDPEGVGLPTWQLENPFQRYRKLLYSHDFARRNRLGDCAYGGLVHALDQAVARVDGRGFVVTPFARADALSEELGFSSRGGVWIKDETRNVGGSHKARHLAAIALQIQVAERLGLLHSDSAPLAIASCGNAALAAAILAAAIERPLDVYVPPDAGPHVLARLEELGANIIRCPRAAGEVGDPCYLRFRRAVRDGAIPFTCQGPDNALNVEGGATLGYEIIGDLRSSGLSLDRLFVQVGGGALASACALAFADARSLGVDVAIPRMHTVQTRGAHPLHRAYSRVVEEVEADLGTPRETAASVEADVRADRLRSTEALPIVRETLRDAARHRSAYMWPWEVAPQSVARGILDDETYDWMATVEGMLASGGDVVVVDEQDLVEARRLGDEVAGIAVDATGAAGLAGLLTLRRSGRVRADERVAVLFTGGGEGAR